MFQIIGDIGLLHYLIVSTMMFGIGLIGIILNRRNVIFTLMAIELMLLAVNINFVAFSSCFNDITGQVFSIIILSVAAAESAIGLAIIVVHFRNSASIEMEDLKQLKG